MATEQEGTTTTGVNFVSTSTTDDIDTTTSSATTEGPGGVTTTTRALTMDFTDATDNMNSTVYAGSSTMSHDQPTTNIDRGEASTAETEQSTTDNSAATTTTTVMSTYEEFKGTTSPVFSCRAFSKDLETILNSTVSQY